MTIANYYKCDDCHSEWLDTTDNRVTYNGKKLCTSCYKKIVQNTGDSISHSEQIINESFIQKICSFFMKREFCRGYDLTSPLGRIADRAFKHWNDVARKEESIKELTEQRDHFKKWFEEKESKCKMLSGDILYYQTRFKKAQNILKNLYKVKCDETDPLKWNEPKLEDKVIHKERIFSAESLKEAQEIANQSFHLCQFYLYRYNEELGDFDEAHNLQFAVEEKGKIWLSGFKRKTEI